jgi:hydrogenase maturation protein HypF
MCEMLEAEPHVVVSDKHPMYNTVSFAEEYSKEHGIPLIQIQHHYAHILSCMAENGFKDKVIGLSLDGTGYGDDGTIWGGEILLSDYCGFERKGSISPFMQVGGDISAKEGWRIAAAMLGGCFQRGRHDK